MDEKGTDWTIHYIERLETETVFEAWASQPQVVRLAVVLEALQL